MSKFSVFSAAVAGDVWPVKGTYWAAQLSVTGTGAVTATVIIEATNIPGDSGAWQTLDTLTVTGASPQRDFGSGGPVAWANIRARCTGITGTDASAAVVINVA